MELQQDDGPRSSVGIGSGSDDAVRSRRSSLGDSSKGSGNSLGTRWEIVGRRPENSPQECRRLPDWRDIWQRASCVKQASDEAPMTLSLHSNVPGPSDYQGPALTGR
ncbi:hypothetical protein GW17_00011014 [Ensete ventricosum]|nr:hypothetical protein GW17_00011014 [Ensete ventricosum]